MQYYKVVAYVRAECEPEEYTYYTNLSDAQEERSSLELMDPFGENVFRIHEIDDSDPDWPDDPTIFESDDDIYEGTDEAVISRSYNPNDPANW